MDREIKFAELLKIIEKLPHESEKLWEIIQAVSDGRIAIDAETRSFLIESCMALQILSRDVGEYKDEGIPEVAGYLVFHKDGKGLAAIDSPVKDGRFEIEQITPGNYTLGTSTGLLLWQKKLKEDDLFIGKSSKKDGKFRMAADTGIDSPNASITDDVANGSFTIKVFPGFNAGRIEIIFNSTEGN